MFKQAASGIQERRPERRLPTAVLLSYSVVISISFPNFGLGDEIKIVGGVAEADPSFRFAVALLWSEDRDSYEYPITEPMRAQRCGATYLGKRYVLTAAHCVAQRPIDRRAEGDYPPRGCEPEASKDEICKYRTDHLAVLVGTDRLLGGNGTRIKIANITLHPAYAASMSGLATGCAPAAEFDHDVAVIELAEDPPAGLPAALVADEAFEERLLSDHLTLAAVGWGQTSDPGSGSNQLMRTELPVQPNDLCEVRHLTYRAWANSVLPSCIPKPVVTKSMICAGFDTRPAGTCYGDSGGFLGRRNQANRWVQVGVTSWGAGCATPYIYDVFASVAAHRKWLEDVTGVHFPSPGLPKTSGSGTE